MKQQSVWMALLKSAGYALLFYVCQIAASMLSEFAILFGMAARGDSLEQALEQAPLALNHVMYEILLLSGLIFLGVAVLIKRKKSTEDMSLKKTSSLSVVASLALGLGCYFVVSIGLPILSALFPAVQQSQEEYMENYEQIMSQAPALWADLAYACLMAPLVEELLCRGLILNTLKKSMRPGTAVFLAALIFAFLHGNIYQIVFTLPLGILLGVVVHRSGSVWSGFLLHAAFNFGNYLVRWGSLFGFSEDSGGFLVCFWVALLFCAVCFPVGTVMWLAADRKMKPVVPFFARPATPDFVSVSQVPIGSVPPRPAASATSATPNSVCNEKGQEMASPEFLIVGLGNPEERYSRNRHNCGFMAVDYIALRQNVSLKNLRFRALTAETVIEGKKVLLMKPQTYMNLSGEAVREAASFYKIPPEKILILFDDINFAPGTFRIRPSGSAGGHNGIKSIIACLGSEGFPRVKMGVGAPPAGWELMNWVLGNPSKEDLDRIIASLEDIYASSKLFCQGRLEQAAAQFNGKLHG